ncbi:MAG TPA: hypothetical protein VLL77_14220 [Anaerolineales bacterium]|nr:hypothetical protein [Anaerolineales bacterium]
MRSLPVLTGLLGLGAEALILLALFEIPPFGRGSSDIVWALPCFGLVVLGLAGSGSAIALARRRQVGRDGWIVVGIVLNGMCLAVPVAALAFGVARALIVPG